MGADSRLDPVRWHRPGRATLSRLAAVAALLVTAAVVAWSGDPADPDHPDSAMLSSPRHPDDFAPAAGAPHTGPAEPDTVSAASPSARTPPGPAAVPDAPGDARHDGSAAPRSGRPAIPLGSVGVPVRPAIPPGNVGVPVRLAEPAALALLRPGDRVTLLRIEDAGAPTKVADAALVLAVTGADDPISGGLLVALSPAEARHAVVSPGRGFAVLLRPD